MGVPKACWSLELAMANLAGGQTRTHLYSRLLFILILRWSFCPRVRCDVDLHSTGCCFFLSGAQEIPMSESIWEVVEEQPQVRMWPILMAAAVVPLGNEEKPGSLWCNFGFFFNFRGIVLLTFH